MPFSSGTFTRTFDCTTDRDNGVKILASKFDTEFDGIATGLSTCILKDGTQTCTAAIPFAEGLTIPDNKTIVLGTNSDITIQYDETTNDSLEIAANVEGAALGVVLKADQGDDNADQHKLNIADGGVLTLQSKISGGFVTYLTHTPNATVADSTTAVAGNLTVAGDLTLGSGAVINEAELEAIDGVTAGTVAASKAVIVDGNKDIASFRNVTLTGELDAGSLDISGDADIDGTLEADAMTLNGTAITATATLDTGISNNNVPKFTSGVADDDFLRVDGTAIEGRSASEVLSDIGAQASLTFGISNTNAVKIDSSSVADDEYARFTASGLESRSNAEVLSDIGALPLAGGSMTGAVTITTADNSAQLTLKSTDADGSTGPNLVMTRASGSPADNDAIGELTFNFNNDAAESTVGTRWRNFIIDASDGTEDAAFDIFSMKAGSLTSILNYDASELVFNDGSADINLRVESNGNANMLVVDAGNDRIGIGTNTPAHDVEIVATADGSVNDSLQIRNNATSSGTGSRIRFINSTDNTSDANGAAISSVRNGDDNDLVFETENATRMTIDHAGNVGIGTDSPNNNVHIQTASGNPELRVESTGANYATVSVKNSSRHYSTQIRTDQSNAYVVRDETGSANRFLIETGSAEAARIDSSNRVLVGSSSNNASGTSARLQVSYTKNNEFGIHVRPSDNNTGGGNPMLFQNQAGTTIGTISADASNVAFNTSSDYRLKDGIVDMTGAIDRVKALAPKRFYFIENPDKTVDGFLAHEAQAVVSEAVTGTKDETREVTNVVLSSDGKLLAQDVLQADWTAGKLETTDDNGNAVDALYPSDSTWSASHDEPVMQGIDQSKLVPLLTGALREAIAKIETLETKVAALEAGS